MSSTENQPYAMGLNELDDFFSADRRKKIMLSVAKKAEEGNVDNIKLYLKWYDDYLNDQYILKKIEENDAISPT